MLLMAYYKFRVRPCFRGLAILLCGLLLASCANISGKNPAATKTPKNQLQTSLQNLIDSNIVQAIASNALAPHDIVDYVTAALRELQNTYSVDQAALLKQLNKDNAKITFYKAVYAVYSKRKEVAPETVNRTAIEAMLRLVDTKSRYYDAASYRELKQAIGERGVIGVVLSHDRKGIRVVELQDSGSAEQAGLPVGSHIIAINGQNVQKRPLADVNILLRGKPGSYVVVSARRPDNVLRTYKMRRAILKIKNVSVKKLKHNILYIRIARFDFAAKKEILTAYDAMHFKPAGVILDLRTSSGGIIKSIVAVGDLFLNSGDFISIRSRNRLFDVNYGSRSGDLLENIAHIAVLVSAQTASGAEGLALTLRKRVRARIIGSRTAGRNLIQGVYPLRDGSAVKLTTGRLELADGQTWTNQGIRPDVCVDFARNRVVRSAKRRCKHTYYNSKTPVARDIALQLAVHDISVRR